MSFTSTAPTLDEYFAGWDESRRLFDELLRAVNTIGTADIQATKSQVNFFQKKTFAWVWIPGKYLRGRSAPLVLTFSFREREPSPRWKEIVEPSPGRFTHHLELHSSIDIDDEVREWLRGAWMAAE